MVVKRADLTGGAFTAPQVRFQVDVRSDESLPGIIARSAREHVLPQIFKVLTAADIEIYNPGAIITLESERIPLLSHVLRQPRETLEVRLASKEGKSLRFGDLLFPMGTFELRQRRIGPRSLEIDPHHRFAWMNRLLPCCPVTGEHLVDRCDACSEPLRWYRTWGIGACESCRKQVTASSLPPLRDDQLADYRVISDLMSHDQETRGRCLLRLPEGTRRHPPGTLAQTAIQMVSLFEGQDGLGGEIYQFFKRDPGTQTDIVCRAGRMLGNWPDGLREEFRMKVERLADDHEQFFLMWRSLKRFSTPKLVGEDKAKLVLEGLPDLKENIWRSFTSEGNVYSTQDTMRVLGTDNKRTKKLAAVPALVHMEKPSRYRGNRQFKADAIDELRRIKDASTTFATITDETGIPTYGVEQLSAVGWLEFRGGEAMALAYPRPFVSTSSLQDLVNSVGKQRRKSRAPKSARRLNECSRILGGGEKPWCLIVEALVNGDLAFWGEKNCFDMRQILVRPKEMRQFLGKRFDVSRYKFNFGTTYAKRDAAEVLTIDPPLLDACLNELDLNFQKIGRAKEIEKNAILEIARTIVSNAELGEHLGIAPKSVRFDKRMRGISRRAYGWQRREVLAAGLLSNSS